MSWHTKEQLTPFEAQPIDGLFFLIGDLYAKAQNAPYAAGMKYPKLMFPSGAACEVWGIEYPLVHIFDALDLPLFESRDSAYVTALEWNEDSYYSVFKVGDDQLEVWDHATESVYTLIYDNKAEQIKNVELQR